MVIGSRYIRGGGVFAWELWRRLLSQWGNFYCHLVTSLPISDCTGGYNTISAAKLRMIDFSKLSMLGYAFQFELKYTVWKMGFKIKEVPIIFKNRVNGDSKISHDIIKEGLIAPWKLVFGAKRKSNM